MESLQEPSRARHGYGSLSSQVGQDQSGQSIDSGRSASALWNAVRARTRTASASGPPSERPESRSFDAEGLSSDSILIHSSKSIAPGQHADHWQSLAHLFDDHHHAKPTDLAQQAQARVARPSRHSRSPSNSRTLSQRGRSPIRSDHPPLNSRCLLQNTATSPYPFVASSTSSSSAFGSRRFLSPPRVSLQQGKKDEDGFHVSSSAFSQEPSSWIDSNPHSIPEGEDPLEYSPHDQLLESGTESDSDDHRPHKSNEPSSKDSNSFSQGGLGQLSFPMPNNLWKGIREHLDTISLPLKCAIAYLIASLFTFIPFFSSHMARLLPNHDPNAKVPISNLHMIATVAVYFHPAKSLGAMLEADLFALIAFVYSIALSFSSMAAAVFLHEAGMPILSNVLSVLVFLGLGMSLVGYAKVKVGKPQFNTACSLIGVIVFTVAVKEGSTHLGHFSTDKTFQVSLVVLVGTLVSNLVCFFLWPQSATTNLQNDISRNLQGFATLLKVLTKTFLLDDPSNFHIKSDKIKQAIDDHHDSFTSLKKNLLEAKLESPFDLRMRGMNDKYDAATDSLNRLAQHLTGLRSSCGLQHEIMMAQKRSGISPQVAAGGIARAAKVAAFLDHSMDSTFSDRSSGEALADAEQSVSAFDDFIESVGPHMKSLVFTCDRTLRNLRSTFLCAAPISKVTSAGFDGRQRFRPGDSFTKLKEDISAALRRFQHEQTVAIKRIYTMEPKREPIWAQKASSPVLEGKGGPDEEIFLIFFFVFNLEEFGKELEILVNALEAIRLNEERLARARATSWFERMRLFFPFDRIKRRKTKAEDLRDKRKRKAVTRATLDFPSNRRHQINTGQTPAAMTIKEHLQRIVWSIGEFLRQPDTKFAIKAGVGSAILASPAFFKSTRHVFNEYKGQWALVSFMVVLSPTVGQSNQMSLHRIIGTILGAASAYGIYTLFPDNNVILPIFGFFFSIPCFKYIVGHPQYASSGRFVLLTYNLTALYSYNLRKVGIEVEQIAFHRTAAVIAGVIWATVLNQLVWPFEARRELALGVSDLIFKLAWLYQRLVLTYSSEPKSIQEDGSAADDDDDDELENQPLLATSNNTIDEFQAIELHLQVAIIKLEGLLSQTKHEPRLKGPFPVATYTAMIACCQNILDKLHSMRCVTTRDAWYQQVRQDFVIPVNEERREMVGNVLLFFYTLGSAFHLKIPVPPYFPPASRFRLALIAKIRELPVVKRRAVRGSNEYLLFYSYALAMKDVISQLEELGRLTQSNFGIWGGSIESFERQFQANPNSVEPTPFSSRKPSISAPKEIEEDDLGSVSTSAEATESIPVNPTRPISSST
ncbi:hypothetical protein IE53DRAFT_405416 [Violaceomyces palustris]|uniref:Uncharacterized protein n=1 Tax=Violaceomyces palustris TaxID=1673888 RepID=A0ACD0P1F6_9BASI|nr:hypothetical protein IE53DRAFT_405416 [Violaceomyces palustris]